MTFSTATRLLPLRSLHRTFATTANVHKTPIPPYNPFEYDIDSLLYRTRQQEKLTYFNLRLLGDDCIHHINNITNLTPSTNLTTRRRPGLLTEYICTARNGVAERSEIFAAKCIADIRNVQEHCKDLQEEPFPEFLSDEEILAEFAASDTAEETMRAKQNDLYNSVYQDLRRYMPSARYRTANQNLGPNEERGEGEGLVSEWARRERESLKAIEGQQNPETHNPDKGKRNRSKLRELRVTKERESLKAIEGQQNPETHKPDKTHKPDNGKRNRSKLRELRVTKYYTPLKVRKVYLSSGAGPAPGPRRQAAAELIRKDASEHTK